MGAAEHIEWSGEYPALLWCLHPCESSDDPIEPANDNAQRLRLIERHSVPQSEQAFPHARAGVLCDNECRSVESCRPSTRQGEAQLAQAHRAEQAGGWGLPNYRFTGKEEDVEVGLTYFGKRYLNPLLGRWISADPLAIHAPGEADLNVYAYVSGSVLKNVDPLGLDEESKTSDSLDPGKGSTEQVSSGGDDGPRWNMEAEAKSYLAEEGAEAFESYLARPAEERKANASTPAKSTERQVEDAVASFTKDAVESAEKTVLDTIREDASAGGEYAIRRKLGQVQLGAGRVEMNVAGSGRVTVNNGTSSVSGRLQVSMVGETMPVGALGGGRLRLQGDVAFNFEEGTLTGREIRIQGYSRWGLDGPSSESLSLNAFVDTGANYVFRDNLQGSQKESINFFAREGLDVKFGTFTLRSAVSASYEVVSW